MVYASDVILLLTQTEVVLVSYQPWEVFWFTVAVAQPEAIWAVDEPRCWRRTCQDWWGQRPRKRAGRNISGSLPGRSSPSCLWDWDNLDHTRCWWMCSHQRKPEDPQTDLQRCRPKLSATGWKASEKIICVMSTGMTAINKLKHIIF